mmetsp:Transcript_21961/g.46197  ORF Transcript_21961/g.46197 Transcript_21961/m.46197 type:complete len:274 (+) Transcript_21961:55-876(+)
MYSQPQIIRHLVQEPTSPSLSRRFSVILLFLSSSVHQQRVDSPTREALFPDQTADQLGPALGSYNVRQNLSLGIPRVCTRVLQQGSQLPDVESARGGCFDQTLERLFDHRTAGGIRKQARNRVGIQVPQNVEVRIGLAGHTLEGSQRPCVVQKVRWKLEAKTGNQSDQNIQQLVEAQGWYAVAGKDQDLGNSKGQLVRQCLALDRIGKYFLRQELELAKEFSHGRDVFGKDQLADSADQAILDGSWDRAQQSEINVTESIGRRVIAVVVVGHL